MDTVEYKEVVHLFGVTNDFCYPETLDYLRACTSAGLLSVLKRISVQ